MSSTPSSFFTPPVAVDLAPLLGSLDHSNGGRWHTEGPPNHLTLPEETTLVPPLSKSILESVIPFMEEYYWRVDNGTHKELWEQMFTPSGMYFNNALKLINHGFVDGAHMDQYLENGWLKHQMDRIIVLPTDGATSPEDTGPVLVHVLGSCWSGPRTTKKKEEQKPANHRQAFSQTFEILRSENQWKIHRVLLMMHDDFLMHRKEIFGW
jgi:hypothetical protein